MPESAPAVGRRYGGQDAAERRAERRARFIEAGLELFGTQGYAGTSVRAICGEARLTERYFYEAVRDREELLAVVYEELVQEVQTATFAAVAEAGPEMEDQVTAGLGTFVRVLSEDPRKARVILVEVVGASTRLENRRHRVIHEFADFIADLGKTHAPEKDRQWLGMIAVALVGGVNELLVSRTPAPERAGDSRDRDRIVGVCTSLFLGALR
ncbi:TetR/AcrR family transcriptional regulator [Streptomyces sp. XM4193]|uniref:TetR/AcrR family transcriptional regulator n=1 Tax=Streptomyces sp. XM4193 TaxID=2929782 RepID=UPI001FFA5193|nr:TetR/AcrR family transcriptional regulator [Streptomyces sp. XM4193]MCK1796447.1 TetR/AcrR family transcriptional regulator [Streptomyces sp. XM4193]